MDSTCFPGSISASWYRSVWWCNPSVLPCNKLHPTVLDLSQYKGHPARSTLAFNDAKSQSAIIRNNRRDAFNIKRIERPRPRNIVGAEPPTHPSLEEYEKHHTDRRAGLLLGCGAWALGASGTNLDCRPRLHRQLCCSYLLCSVSSFRLLWRLPFLQRQQIAIHEMHYLGTNIFA